MKLRLEDNTLRLRLSAAEVQTFAATGRVQAATHLGPGPSQQLSYALERSDVLAADDASPAPVGAGLPPPEPEIIEAAGLRYTPGRITVLVPAALAEEWTTTTRAGFSAEILVFESNKLRILVEKDLDCRH